MARFRLVAMALAAVLGWYFVSLMNYVDQHLNHIEVLRDTPPTPGTTWLLVGTDGRGEGGVYDHVTEGARADAILILHQPESGPTALISIPRDTYVPMPTVGPHWITYALG